jgi:hypothetical protein
MLSVDEDALICDFAETYHILDLYSLPIDLAAVLACGLREDSRIKMKIAGISFPMQTLFLAAIMDNTSWLKWSKTKDAEKGINQPESIFNQLVKPDEKKAAFTSGEDFESAKREFDKKIKLLGRE